MIFVLTCRCRIVRTYFIFMDCTWCPKSWSTRATGLTSVSTVELEVRSVDGTWKLNQNRPAEARLNAARHVDGEGLGMETDTLAGLMRNLPEAG